MRLSVPSSTAPLQSVDASFHPLRVPSLSYAVPRIRNVVSKVTAIVASITLLVVLARVVQQTVAWRIEHHEQGAATKAIDDMLHAHVQRMVAGGDPWPREPDETEADYRERHERFADLCNRAGVARADK